MKVLFAAAMILFTTMASHAATLRFDVASTCETNCGVIGLNSGDAVSGFLLLDATGFGVGGATYGFEDVLDFEFTFGNLTVSFANAFGFTFGTLPTAQNTATELANWSFSASTLGPGTIGGIDVSGGSLGLSGNTAGPGITCSDAQCSSLTGLPPFARVSQFGAVTGVPVAPTPIPLPATLPLLIAGLAGLVAVRRRRCRRERACETHGTVLLDLGKMR